MRRGTILLFSLVVSLVALFPIAQSIVRAVTVADVAAKIKSLKAPERIAYLLKGAQAEGELAYYGTLPIDEFLPLARVYDSRYRAMALNHYFSPREGILNRALTEGRAGRHSLDVVQVDLSYG